MAKIVWDATGERFYETGVSKGVLYVQKKDGTYENGVAWNGLTSVSENPDGAEPNDLYADNIKYATLISAETFGATIEAYTFPEEFAICDGSYTPTGATGVYIGQQPRRPFGFCYRTEIGNDASTGADAGYKLHIIYNATASPSDKGYETINDSPDAITLSWEVTTTPVDTGIEGVKPTATIVIDSTKLDSNIADNLAVLEGILYGTDGNNATEPTLPTPAQVINVIKTGSLQ